MDESGQRLSYDIFGVTVDCLLSVGLVSMNRKVIIFVSLIVLAFFFTFAQAHGASSRNEEVSQERLVVFAKCITKRDWVMYSSFTCSACRVQRELFGQASVHLKIVECNPHAPDTKVERCLEKNIRFTPTWIMEKDGKEIKRIEGYQLLEDLASKTGCPQ